jgi:general L-amino acid transport system substrate-binding protein
MKRIVAALVATLLASFAGAALAQPKPATLALVKERGHLVCGVDGEQLGFSIPMRNGHWTGFDVDYCRAIAAAIFGDASKANFVPLSATERFDALRSGAVDILARNTTWTFSRDVAAGLNFAGVTYFDGQAFMARRETRLASALDLSGATICVERGTTTEMNLVDYFRANRMQLRMLQASSNAEMLKAYEEGKCVAMTADASALYGERLRLLGAERHVVLPEIISKEPLGPAVRHGDDQWFDIVRWVHAAMVTAEELGLDRRNVDAALRSANPEVQRLLGIEGRHGEALGLPNRWAYEVVKQVGSYGEVFERNLGRASPLGMPRRLNGLWTSGGLQYAPPIR